MKRKSIIINICSILAVAVLVGLDQLSKLWVRNSLTGGREVVIWKGVFKLVSHKNTGAVWGIMSNQTLFLSIITIFILAAVVWLYIRIPAENSRLMPLKIITVFVAAGAIGNFIDRVTLKYVVDFLYFELIDFPVFNVADCYITVSMFLMIILFLFVYKDEDLNPIFPKKKTEG